MTPALAADRIADGFPHGTPAGYRDGCRGNGGCPNRGTTRMTCKDAQLRYATDLAYRRAYDAGDIWLDVAAPRDAEKERVRDTRIRRATAGTTPAPETGRAAPAAPPAPQPAAAPVAAVKEDEQTKLRAARRDRLDAALARIAVLEQQLATAENLTRIAAQERATAIADTIAAISTREAAIAELTAARSRWDELTDLNRRLTPQRRAAVEFVTSDEGLHLSLNALIDPGAIDALANFIARRTA